MNIEHITPELFDKEDVDKWKKHLLSEGYVVLKDILGHDEIEKSVDLFKKDWTTVSPKFDFNDKQTWGIENSPMIYSKGMVCFSGFGQSNFMWNLRTKDVFQNIYQHIHKTRDLVVSLDGFSVYLSDKQKSKPWLHVDQNPINKVLSIQGAYNHFKVDEHDAGFIIVPKSHLGYNPLVKHSKDWIILSQEEQSTQKAYKLIIPSNCFTLFNSKCIHANQGITKKNVTEFNRLSAFISYFPKAIRSEDVKNEKIASYKNGLTNSHWANKCVVKQYPWGFSKTYCNRGYSIITPTLIDEKMPENILQLL